MNPRSRIPDEIFVFGMVYVNAAPEGYVEFAYDCNRLRSMSEYLAIEKFGNPPQLSANPATATSRFPPLRLSRFLCPGRPKRNPLRSIEHVRHRRAGAGLDEVARPVAEDGHLAHHPNPASHDLVPDPASSDSVRARDGHTR